MLLNEFDEIPRRVAGQRRFAEVRIAGNKIFGPRVDIRKIAAAAARDKNFAADLRVMFDDQNAPPAFSRFDRAKKAGRTAADNDAVVLHLRQITVSKDIQMMADVSGHNICNRPNGNRIPACRSH